MEKTEKSMVELELELNQKTNEWATLCESGGQLQPMYGPGYTGMQNMGNSCYLNSTMQVLFRLGFFMNLTCIIIDFFCCSRIPDFIQRYYEGSESIFSQSPGNPAEDFNVQM